MVVVSRKEQAQRSLCTFASAEAAACCALTCSRGNCLTMTKNGMWNESSRRAALTMKDAAMGWKKRKSCLATKDNAEMGPSARAA